MNLKQLRALFREEAADTAEPFLWSDAYLATVASEAEQEACRRARLLRDSTSALCAIIASAGNPLVMLDSKVLDVLRVRLESYGTLLPEVSVQHMDESTPGWESHVGTPQCVVTDYKSGALRLYPIPTLDAVLRLMVIRLPLAALSASGDEPEIREEYHPALVQWMLHRAYAKQDAETYDQAKSDRALLNFEHEFGRRESARNEQWQRERHEVGAEPIA